MDIGEGFAFACWQRLIDGCWTTVGTWPPQECPHCVDNWRDMQTRAQQAA